jgi:hypothetical protein
MFAMYAGISVMVLGFDDKEALIVFDDGDERYVSFDMLDFV